MGLDYNRFFSTEGKHIGGNPLRNLHEVRLHAPADLVTLANGTPSAETFPLDSVCLRFKDGAEVTIDRSDMDVAQQYGPTLGKLSFRKLLRDLVWKLHAPPCWEKSPEEGGTSVTPTAGITDSLSQVFNMILDRGDNIIVEEFTYPGPVSTFKALGINPLLVAVDENGIIPESLEKLMSRWDKNTQPGTTDKPKLLYTIPTGQNPTGCTIPLHRRKQIYKIAQEYNFLIFEDDPYHMLTFEQLVPSFLSLDTEGRVLRADSFSKTIAPGLRSGYMSGPEPLMSKIVWRIGETSQGTSPFSQHIVMGLFQRWGIDGYLERCKQVAAYYKSQRDLMVKLVNKWLVGLVEYSVPNSGMFLWMKVPGCDDTKDLLFVKAVAEGVLAVPGFCFKPGTDNRTAYIRLSYSASSEAEMDKGLRILSEVLKKNVQK